MTNWKVILGLTLGICSSLFSAPQRASDKPTRSEAREIMSKEPIRNQFTYVDIGLLQIADLSGALVGIGNRYQWSNHGFDYKLHLGVLTDFDRDVTGLAKVNFLYLGFPKPNLGSQFYYGLGVSLGAIGNDWSIDTALIPFISPEFALGLQFKTNTKKYSSKNQAKSNRFIQVQVGMPTLVYGFVMPSVSVNYGWGF